MILSKYKNGNVDITIFKDGTKVRECSEIPKIEFPESIDLKITDYCDMGCSYCHESSTKNGNHANFDTLCMIAKQTHKYTELAIGGGNPLSYPYLTDFLRLLKQKEIIANITVNQGHLKTYFSELVCFIEEKYINGLGISITNNNFDVIKKLLKLTDNIVFHVIVGVNKIEIIDKLIFLNNEKCKILILGYKKFGFGVQFHNKEIDNEIKKWSMYLPKYFGKCILSFDNLAIEQLNVRRLFTDVGWNKFYMGDDFTHSMYIDAVKQEYAQTSRSNKRKSLNDCNIVEYFLNT